MDAKPVLYNSNTFSYWFAHWCAYQMTALNLGVWKFRFLFHDIEKPFLYLFLSDKVVNRIHRKYSRHHIERHDKNYDYLGMVIDWQFAHFTKDAPLKAEETLNILYPSLKEEIMPILIKLKIV